MSWRLCWPLKMESLTSSVGKSRRCVCFCFWVCGCCGCVSGGCGKVSPSIEILAVNLYICVCLCFLNLINFSHAICHSAFAIVAITLQPAKLAKLIREHGRGKPNSQPEYKTCYQNGVNSRNPPKAQITFSFLYSSLWR